MSKRGQIRNGLRLSQIKQDEKNRRAAFAYPGAKYLPNPFATENKKEVIQRDRFRWW